MPSRIPRRLIRILPLALVVVLIGIGFLGVRYGLYRAADRMLDRWEASGLPGSRPEGSGPALLVAWPPVLRWDDVMWQEGTVGIAHCRRLEIGIDPQSVLHHSLRVTQVRIDDLQIEISPPLPSWIDPVVATLTHPSSSGRGSEKPHPEAIRFTCEGLRFDSMPSEFRKVEGWGWTQLPGRWRAVADAITGSGDSLRLRIQGVGVAGDEEVILDVDLAEHRNARCVWQRTLDETPRWTLTGRDDGSLLLAVLPFVPADLFPGLTGIIDFKASGESAVMHAAEAQIHELSIGQPAEDPWRVTGCVSLRRGVLSLEDLFIQRNIARLLVSGRIPLESPSVQGQWKLAGEFEGAPLDIEGVVERRDDAWIVRANRLGWRGARTGPVELIGSYDGWGGADDPPVLRASAIPVSWLESWLSLSLPGHWTGLANGQGRFYRVSGGWRATGWAELREVGITGLPLVEEVGALLGERRGSDVVRLDTVRMRWAMDAGQLVADSLDFEGRTARVTGFLLAVPPDSVFGMLRLTPSGDHLVGAILRLMGGSDAAIDLGIVGRTSHPELVPLDQQARRRWLDEVGRIRNRFWR